MSGNYMGGTGYWEYNLIWDWVNPWSNKHSVFRRNEFLGNLALSISFYNYPLSSCQYLEKIFDQFLKRKHILTPKCVFASPYVFALKLDHNEEHHERKEKFIYQIQKWFWTFFISDLPETCHISSIFLSLQKTKSD